MKHQHKILELATSREMEFIDITSKARDFVKKNDVRNGTLTLYTQHTTSALIINEYEEGLQKDMAIFLSRLAPGGKGYFHDEKPLDGRLNAHGHLQSFLLPVSQSIPIIDGTLQLGRWQNLFFLELDGPRPLRRVTLQVVGE